MNDREIIAKNVKPKNQAIYSLNRDKPRGYWVTVRRLRRQIRELQEELADVE